MHDVRRLFALAVVSMEQWSVVTLLDIDLMVIINGEYEQWFGNAKLLCICKFLNSVKTDTIF